MVYAHIKMTNLRYMQYYATVTLLYSIAIITRNKCKKIALNNIFKRHAILKGASK